MDSAMLESKKAYQRMYQSSFPKQDTNDIAIQLINVAAVKVNQSKYG